MMKVAVTGATGFLGRHILAELARREVEVIGVARSKCAQHKALPVHQWAYVDIDKPLLHAFEAIGKPNILIHLAWGGLPNYQSLHHFEVQLPAQYRFLRQLVGEGLSNLTVTGTCFEYGMQSGCLLESAECKPNNPYGFAKDSLRRQLELLKRVQPFNLAWTRLFYIHGEGQLKSSLWSQLKSAVDRGDKVFNMSGGEQLRDYLPVQQLVRHIVSVALLQADVGPVNISSGEPISVRVLVENWIRDNGWDIELNLGHYPYPDYEPFAFWGDCSRLQSLVKEPVET